MRSTSPSMLTDTARSFGHAGGHRRSGFTLTDLVVGVGVLTLLAGIGFPGLGKSREEAKKIACLSNLRQLGTVFLMYANDNKGKFPRPAPHKVEKADATDPRLEDWIFWQPELKERKLGDAAIAPYLGKAFSANVLRCPSDNVTSRKVKTDGQGPYPYSYVMNEYMSCFPVLHKPEEVARSVAQVKKPTEKILLYEEDARTVDDGGGDLDLKVAVNLLAVRHDAKAEAEDVPKVGGPLTNADRSGNVVYADGHAEPVAQRRPRPGPLPPRRLAAARNRAGSSCPNPVADEGFEPPTPCV